MDIEVNFYQHENVSLIDAHKDEKPLRVYQFYSKKKKNHVVVYKIRPNLHERMIVKIAKLGIKEG